MDSSFFVDGVVLEMSGFSVVLFTAEPTNIRGSLRTLVEVKAFPTRSVTS